MGNGDKFCVVGMGDVHMVTSLGHKLILKNARHIPSLRENLFFISKLNKFGYNS